MEQVGDASVSRFGPRGTRLVAHRGSPLRAPENSLLSITLAAQSASPYIEFDLQLTRDQIPILYHDGSLRRVSGQSSDVMTTTLAEIQRTGAFHPERFGNQFRGLPVNSLQQWCRQVGAFDASQFFVEIKVESLQHFGIGAVLRQVVPLLQAAPVRAVLAAVISKSHEVLHKIRETTGLTIGWVLPEYSHGTMRQADALAPEFIFCNHRRLPRQPGELWSGPWRWVAYTVNEITLAERLMHLGIDLVETDEIELMLDHFRGASPRE